MAFQYEHYRNPYVGTMSDLLAHGNDARARAAEIGGQAWGNAAANIGQTIAQAPLQAAQTRRLTQQSDLGALQLGEERRTIAARNAFAKIIQETPQLDEDGVSLYDIPAVGKQLAALGFDPGGAVDHLGKINEAFRQERAAKLALVKTGAASIIAAGNDPTLAGHFLDQLEKNRTYPPEQIDQFRQFIAADPANVAKLTAMLVGPQKMERGAPGSFAVQPLTGMPIPGSGVPNVQKTRAELAQDAANPNSPTHLQSAEALKLDRPGTPVDAFQTFKETYPRTRGVTTWDQLTPEQQMEGQTAFAQRSRDPGADAAAAAQRAATLELTNQRIADAKAKNSTASAPIYATRPDAAIGNTVEPVTGLTPNALFQAGMIHALEGKFPPVGMGQSTKSMSIRTAVQNTSAAMANQVGVDITELRAEYRANATTLNKLLPAATFTAAAASTALDNLQLAADQSGEVARSGSKFVNHYTQWLKGEFTPAAGLTKFETYIYTAAREYAKVVSGSAQSVAGLSDTAAREATKLLNAAQAPESFAAAVTAMQNDMANVTGNQRKQIANVSGTIANFFGAVHGQGATAAEPVTPPAAPVTLGQIVTVRGQRIRVTKIGPNGTYEGVPVNR